MPKSDLPFTSQFTPTQTPLPQLLSLVERCAGSQETLVSNIEAAFFYQHAGGDLHERREVAKNTVLSLMAYGLLDEDRHLTDFGQILVALKDDALALYEALARHILTNLRGLELIETIRSMHKAGRDITLESLARELRKRGLYVPRGSMNMSGMKAWLAQAGIVSDKGYQVNEGRVLEVLGMGLEDVAVMAGLASAHRAFLRALATLNPGQPIPAAEVVEHAEALYGADLPEKSTPKFLKRLQDAGLIELAKTTGGRGAKSHLVSLTEKGRAEVLIPLLTTLDTATGLALGPLWDKPLADTLAQLHVDDRHVKGVALEALAVHFCRLVDLSFVGWRLRGPATGGAEVDVLAESSRLVFSRWQIQCKNTDRVSLEDVAKEVGVSLALHSTVIVILTTGTVGGEARKYANTIMSSQNLHIALLDGRDLAQVAGRPGRVVEVLKREAEHAMEVKHLDSSQLRTGG